MPSLIEIIKVFFTAESAADSCFMFTLADSRLSNQKSEAGGADTGDGAVTGGN